MVRDDRVSARGGVRLTITSSAAERPTAGNRPPFEPQGKGTMPTKAYAAGSATAPLAPYSFPRREPRPTDVEFDILFCGVCHSDLHTARNEWAAWPTVYPCVPG